jgi:hypothetical protein
LKITVRTICIFLPVFLLNFKHYIFEELGIVTSVSSLKMQCNPKNAFKDRMSQLGILFISLLVRNQESISPTFYKQLLRKFPST